MDKTPLQKLIEHLQDMAESYDPQYNIGIESAINAVHSLLPLEKEFAGKVFEAGLNYEWNRNYGKIPTPVPDFPTYWKQNFEPKTESNEK